VNEVTSSEQAVELARAYLSRENLNYDVAHVVTDTSEFFDIGRGDLLLLPCGAYLIRGNEREGRFGLDDEVKHWVKRAVDLADDSRKVVKLVFHERYVNKIGPFTYECFRSPRKEARILDLVTGHPHFMQGISVEDPKGNNVRVIDYVYGPTLHHHVSILDLDHETYFQQALPGLLHELRQALAALAFLHRHGEKHGDIRRDHLIRTPDERLVWIDFDYNYRHGERLAGLDLVGVGNVLTFVVGGGDQTLHDLRRNRPEVFERLRVEDMSPVFSNRVMNLKKLFPYLPDRLNRILLHFSAGAEVFYDTVDELLADLDEARPDLN